MLASPAVRIAVDDFLGREEHAALLHVFEDDGVTFVGAHSGVLAGVFGVLALIVDGNDHVHAVALAGDVVVRAEAGSGVDAAGAGVHGDVVGQNKAAGLGQEGVVCEHVLEERALVAVDDLIVLEAAQTHDLLGQSLGHDVHLAVGSLYDDVALRRVQCDGEVAGQSPDSRRPDDKEELGLVDIAELAKIVVHGELDIHGRAGIVLVFDLGLGQCSLVVSAPVNGLETLVDVAVFIHLAEHARFHGLEAGIHGLVRVLPVADDAHALEALALHVDVVVGVGVAGRAEVGDAHCLVVELLLLDDGRLDGHAVVIPAGNVRRIVAAHCVGARDEVFDGFVQRVTHVQSTVGERRAVVKVEQGLALVLFKHLVVDVHLLPVLEHLRLALGQTRTHRELGLGEIECCVILLCHKFILHF